MVGFIIRLFVGLNVAFIIGLIEWPDVRFKVGVVI